MNARESILRRLRAHLRDASRLSRWHTRRHFPDLVERFREALVRVGGEAIVVPDEEEALVQIGRLLKEVGAQRVIVNDEAPLNRWDVVQRWPHITWHVVGRSEGDVRAFAALADVGLSGVLAALAETGTLVLGSGPGQSRLATLLPPVHIAVVPAALITTDLFTWVELRPDPMPASLVFVTGPSKTADIEQTLVIGVHGPKRVIAIIVAS